MYVTEEYAIPIFLQYYPMNKILFVSHRNRFFHYCHSHMCLQKVPSTIHPLRFMTPWALFYSVLRCVNLILFSSRFWHTIDVVIIASQNVDKLKRTHTSNELKNSCLHLRFWVHRIHFFQFISSYFMDTKLNSDRNRKGNNQISHKNSNACIK